MGRRTTLLGLAALLGVGAGVTWMLRAGGTTPPIDAIPAPVESSTAALEAELADADEGRIAASSASAERGAPDGEPGRSQASELFGRVVEVYDRDTGLPLAGVEARHREREEPFARSDASGRLRVRIASGTQFALHLRAPDYLDLEWSGDVTSLEELDPDTAHRAPMLRCAWIEGRVSDENGAPLGGCAMYASCAELPFGLVLSEEERRVNHLPGQVELSPGRRDKASMTDAEGWYVVSAIPVDAPQVAQFYLAGYSRARSAPVVVAAGGERGRADVTLERGGTVRGRVLCNGEPWRGDLFWQNGDRMGRGRVSADGSYELKNLPIGEARVSLLRRAGGTEREQRVHVEAGGEHTLDFLWDEARALITGRVTGSDGAPRAEVSVSAATHDTDGRYVSFKATTGADGLYELRVAPEWRYTVRAGGDVTQRSRKGVPAGSAGVDFTLPDRGLLRVRLVDAVTGEPLRTMESTLWSFSWREAGIGEYRTDHLTGLDGVHLDGVLELPLPTGRVDLRFHLHGDGYQLAERRDLPVLVEPPAEPVVFRLERGVDLELRLSPGADGRRLERAAHLFFLLDEARPDAVEGPYPTQGEPSNYRINGVNLRLADSSLITRLLRLDDDRTAVVRALPPGCYVLRAIPDDLAFEPAVIEVAGDERAIADVAWRAR